VPNPEAKFREYPFRDCPKSFMSEPNA
jgi:hypothetical protein